MLRAKPTSRACFTISFAPTAPPADGGSSSWTFDPDAGQRTLGGDVYAVPQSWDYPQLVDGKAVATGPMRAQIGKFTLSGDGLCVGYDSGDNVSEQYRNPGRFTGGTIQGVAFDVSEEAYVDLNRDAAAAFATD